MFFGNIKWWIMELVLFVLMMSWVVNWIGVRFLFVLVGLIDRVSMLFVDFFSLVSLLLIWVVFVLVVCCLR